MGKYQEVEPQHIPVQDVEFTYDQMDEAWMDRRCYRCSAAVGWVEAVREDTYGQQSEGYEWLTPWQQRDGRIVCESCVNSFGIYGMPCWNSLSPEQQTRLIVVGNLEFGWYPEGSDCTEAAYVEIETSLDQAPGPRFYCNDCAGEHIAAIISAMPEDGVGIAYTAHNGEPHVDVAIEACQDCGVAVSYDIKAETYVHHGPACWLATNGGWTICDGDHTSAG